MNKCIYCSKSDVQFSEEHIIPDSIGCPPDMILNNEVCEKCNKKLAYLDNRVVQAYDLYRWMHEIPNKKGTLPKVSSIRNVYTDEKGMNGDNKRLVFNTGKEDVIVEGTEIKLPGYRKNSSAINGYLKVDGKIADFKLTQQIETGRDFIRGIYKIGFEIHCLIDGKERLLSSFFDQFREFIYNDIGDMELFYQFHNDKKVENCFHTYYSKDDRRLIQFRILFMTYYVNFTKDELPYDLLFYKINKFGNDGYKYVKTKGKSVEYY
jgi:hypothetical protein